MNPRCFLSRGWVWRVRRSFDGGSFFEMLGGKSVISGPLERGRAALRPPRGHWWIVVKRDCTIFSTGFVMGMFAVVSLLWLHF